MSIWIMSGDLNTLNTISKNTLVTLLGIEFIEMGDDYLVGRMPVDDRTKQPQGILHGGASCVLAETVGSMAAHGCVDIQQYYCVGLDININHIRSVRSGFITGTARPFHLGRTTQVWGVEMVDDQGRLTAVARLTMAVLKLV